MATKFMQEAVSLLETSGRPLTQVAVELGVQPSMLRKGRDGRRGAVGSPTPTSNVVRQSGWRTGLLRRCRRNRPEVEKKELRCAGIPCATHTHGDAPPRALVAAGAAATLFGTKPFSI